MIEIVPVIRLTNQDDALRKIRVCSDTLKRIVIQVHSTQKLTHILNELSRAKKAEHQRIKVTAMLSDANPLLITPYLHDDSPIDTVYFDYEVLGNAQNVDATIEVLNRHAYVGMCIAKETPARVAFSRLNKLSHIILHMPKDNASIHAQLSKSLQIKTLKKEIKISVLGNMTPLHAQMIRKYPIDEVLCTNMFADGDFHGNLMQMKRTFYN